jgi:hypothetical protein
MSTWKRFSFAFNARRLIIIAIALIFASLVPSALGNAATVIYSRGTNAPVNVMPMQAPAGTGKVVFNNNYPAQIAPLPGNTIRYNDSVAAGVQENVNIARTVQGPTKNMGHSQGAAVAGDAAVAIVQQGIKPASEVSTDLHADPRMPNTGIEIVMQPYAALIAPIAEMRGARADVGVNNHWQSGRYDPYSNAQDPLRNPGGFLTQWSGLAQGGHEVTFDPSRPRHTTDYGDGPITTVEGMEHPWITDSERIANGPVTEEWKTFVREVAPVGDPGSPVVAAPDPARVVAAGVNAVAAAFGAPAPLPMPEAVPAAPVQQVVEQVTNWTPAPEPSYTAPAPAYQAPVFEAPQVQQFTQVANDFVQQVAPQAAPMVNDVVNNAVNQFAGLIGGLHP